ncbi:hypothetical protein ACFL35_14985 [Candidatus Riflebacteria bacterium]
MAKKIIIVLVAVILIGAGFFLRHLDRVKTGKTVNCLRNIRTILGAFEMYNMDNEKTIEMSEANLLILVKTFYIGKKSLLCPSGGKYIRCPNPKIKEALPHCTIHTCFGCLR